MSRKSAVRTIIAVMNSLIMDGPFLKSAVCGFEENASDATRIHSLILVMLTPQRGDGISANCSWLAANWYTGLSRRTSAP